MSLFNTISQALTTERMALQHFQTSLGEVELRLARQRTEVVISEGHRQFLETRATAVESTCADMLWQLKREFFNIVSSEVLLLIFQDVTPDLNEWSTDELYFDIHLARAPFRLAAVCKRWRCLATSTSTLWTYLALPALRYLTQADVGRVSCLIRRSQQAPVDVIARWNWAESTKTTGPHANAISQLIGSLGHRIRLIHWTCKRESDYVALEALRGPTPHLKQLRVRSASQGAPSIHIGFLPSAPRLKVLEWTSNHISWSFAAQQYTALTVLTVWGYHNVASLPPIMGDGLEMLKLLRIVSNNLEELNLGNSVDGVAFGESVCLELPRLTTLRIRDWDWARYLRAPALQKVAVSSTAWQRTTPPSDALQSFARATHLELFTPCDANDIVGLAQLVNIVTLEICATTWIGYESVGDLSENFLAEAIAHDPSIWPKLKHLRFDTGFMQCPVSDTDLVAFLRSRNERAATQPEERVVSRIASVTFDHGLPGWLVQEVSRLTALS